MSRRPTALFTYLTWLLFLTGALGSLYLVAAAVAVRQFARRPKPRVGQQPPVTIMKPLCGDEPELYENLRSYCTQDHPSVQLVFGVQDPRDPTIALVRRLIEE